MSEKIALSRLVIETLIKNLQEYDEMIKSGSVLLTVAKQEIGTTEL
jgi:hypothetical protein